MLQEKIAPGVSIEIAGTVDLPAGASLLNNRSAGHLESIHEPDGDAPVGMDPCDVALAVAVKVADLLRAPSQTGTENVGAADEA
jgi:hypothetical protein